jgi:hypothetical protein
VSEYVREIIVKRQFQGDNVTVVLKPVKFSDALKFSNLDVAKLSVAELGPMVQDMKGYITKLDGLKAHDASDVTADEMFESAYFAELVTDVLTEWIGRGLPSNPSSAGA